jgi:2-hydroxycyclohexanecarboxyl-CoA dehydrogenase
MSTLTGQVGIVTGGASGIGKAVCLALAAEGVRVAVADIDTAGAQKVAAACEERGADAIAVTMDVADNSSVEFGVDETIGKFGHIDVLANVAGWDRIIPFVETSEDFWDRVIGINFRGVVSTCHAVLPHMFERGGGSIVNVASDAGRAGSSGEAVYSGAKGGVIAFSKSVAREAARKGVRVNVVAPGLVDTPLLDAIREDGSGRTIDAIVAATPLRRLGQPEEVAEAVVFFASDRSSFCTGQTLSVSGGLTMV